jgi:hypothetical protein
MQGSRWRIRGRTRWRKKDVETALLNWGRFFPVLSAQEADLIIVIRKGHGRLVDDTISDPRQNNRTGVINPTDSGVGIGAQHGRQPTTTARGRRTRRWRLDPWRIRSSSIRAGLTILSIVRRGGGIPQRMGFGRIRCLLSTSSGRRWRRRIRPQRQRIPSWSQPSTGRSGL